ncbi:MAG: phage tail sheath C-terminal domain-containing protein [Candidatus Korobacteraceae bacterium]
MPEYLSPGVYIEEQDTGPQPIEGVSTSTTGFVGMTVRGPISGPPVLVTSFAEFSRTFGSFLPDSLTFHDYRYLPYAVKGFFDNLGQRAYIVRVQGQTNGTAGDGGVLVGGLLTQLAADAPAGNTAIQLATTRGIQKGANLTFKQVKNGIATQEGPIAVDAYQDSGQVTLHTALTNSYQAQYTTVITDETNPGTHCQISAADPGAWGNQISVQIRQSSQAQAQVVSIAASLDTVLLNSTANFYPGAIVEFNKGTSKAWKKIKSIAGSSIVVTNAFGATTDLDPDAGSTVTTVRSCEFDILASYGGVNEQWRSLSMDDTIPNYYGTVINNGSTLLSMTSGATGDHVTDTPFIFPSAPDGLNLPLINGSDGTAAPADSDYIGVDNGPGNRTGIQALTDAEDIAIVAVPGIVSQSVQNALITHCETLQYRFAVLDPAPHAGDNPPTLTDIQSQRNQYDTKYAAIYYPRIVVLDPLTDVDITVPPSGHMAGIYARVDDQRGVYKAPANEVIGGIDAIEVKVSKGDQDILNPEPLNINVLRDFTAQSRGLRVYGARCITSDPEWKYINVRRLFIFLEHSLDQGTQWAVFEPNDQNLWARLTQSVSAFLTSVWKDGALMGSKAEEAFFVKCDQTTMSPDDIDNGRLIMVIGVAPVYPAEFVIIRIGQWAGGSSVQEL